MQLREIVSLLVVCFGTLLVAGAAAANQKVTLCHVPPDDPSNAHEIVVSEKALDAHLRNHPGDQVGTCQVVGCVGAGDCDDADACTTDICNADGTCDNNQPVDCADGDVCTMDACDTQTGCENPPVPDADQVACDDADDCSDGDVCVAGICDGNEIPGCCTSDADCTASDACATRYCEDATSTCQEVDLSTQCTAGACEVAFCDTDVGCGTAPVTCDDDGDICTVAECNPFICGDAGGCETFPNPNPPEEGPVGTCDDALDNDCDGLVDGDDPDCNVCTTNLECFPYACESGSCLVTCQAHTDCALEFGVFCDASGRCVFKKGLEQPCFENIECQSGFCTNGACQSCVTGNDCDSGLCSNGVCQ